MNRAFCIGLAGLLVVAALGLAAPASADNSNSNTNNNDVTQVGDGSNSSGETTDENTAWPPTDLDWPPSDLLKADDTEKSGKSSAPPIVMPAGQTAPQKSDTSTTTTPKAKPIVAAGP
ncbi:MAG: hypothetical protein QOH60_1238 [Mycobacterium sp.]|jgi:hypothetical protein|nr:hypothetical protein [Mycobacterium sp.]